MSAVTQLTHSLLLNAEPAPDDLDAVDDDDALERSTFSAITTRRHTFFSHIKAPLTTATRHVISLQKVTGAVEWQWNQSYDHHLTGQFSQS